MNKKQLKNLIDTEVSKVFSDMTSKEPEKEMRETKKVKSSPKKTSLTEEELDDILFYGGKKKKEN
jgi:hypothetical protein